LKMNWLTAIIMPRLPLICTETNTCKVVAKVDYEMDYANRVVGVIPTNTMDIQVAKDSMALVKYHHSTKSSPMLMTISSPTFLTTPLHASLSLHDQNEVGFKIVSNVLVPIELEMMMQKDMKIAKIEFTIADIHLVKVMATGDMKLVGMIPEMINYELTMTLLNEKLHCGKIILNLETTANKERILKITVDPTFLPMLNFEVKNVAKHFTFSFLYDLHTPGLPLICNGVSTCKWTMLVSYEIDFGNSIFFILPTDAFKFNIAKDTNTITDFEFNIMKNPMMVKFDFPLLLSMPFEFTLEYELVKEYALALHLNIPTLKTAVPVEFKFNLQKDLKVVEVAFMAYGINLLDVKGTGDVKLVNIVPEKITYEVEYKIVQGWIAEGKLDINIDMTKAEKLVTFTLAPKALPSVGVTLMATFNWDFSFSLAHSIQINQADIYVMEHKNVVEYIDAKWTAVYTDRLEMPSSIHRLFEKTYFGHILINFDRKATFEVDTLTPSIFVYNIHFEYAFLDDGSKIFAVSLEVKDDAFVFNVFYPIGMDFFGYNTGLQQLIGKDEYKFKIVVDRPNHKLMVVPGFWNLKLHILLPEWKKDTLAKIFTTYSPNDLTLFEITFAKTGYVIEAKMAGSFEIPNNIWSTAFNYEVDFHNWVYHMFPVQKIYFNIEKNENILISIHHTNSGSSNVFFSLTAPAILTTPIELHLPNKISMIAEPIGEMASTFINLLMKSIFENNMNNKITKIHVPFIMDPLLTVNWKNTELMANKLNVVANIPNWMTVSALAIDWNCKGLVDCTIKNDLDLKLPILGETKLKNLNTILLGTAKSQVSMKVSTVPGKGLVSLLPPMDISYLWINSKIYNNQVQTTIDSSTLGKILDLNMEGRCKNLLKCTYKTELSGEVPVVGKYHLSESHSYHMKSNISKISSSASATFSKGFLGMFPKITHSLSADFDHTNLSLEASSTTDLYGNTYGIIVSDNKIVQILY